MGERPESERILLILLLPLLADVWIKDAVLQRLNIRFSLLAAAEVALSELPAEPECVSESCKGLLE
jgi:hypothetical protein